MSEIPLNKLIVDPDTRVFGLVLAALGIRYLPADSATYGGVLITPDGKVCLVIPANYFDLNIKEQLFVLAHEAAHLFANHLGRAGRKVNQELYNYATDAIINSILIKEYPSTLIPPTGIITLDLLIKEGWLTDDFTLYNSTAERIYNQLVSHPKLKALWKFLKSLTSIDKHEDLENLDPMLQRLLEGIIRDASASGNSTSNLFRRLENIFLKPFPFEAILRKELERTKYNFNRPSRRVRIPDSFIPRREVPKFKVFAAIDVSGSCYDYTESFLGYLKGLPEFEEVVFFDTEIKQVWKRGKPFPVTVSGYGGTDLNCVMEHWIALAKKIPQNINTNFLILTDGEIPEINTVPAVGNFLVFTTNREVQPRNGQWRNIRITPDKKKA